MRLLSTGRGQRLVRAVIFAVAIVGAWWGFATHLSADKALALLILDLNTP